MLCSVALHYNWIVYIATAAKLLNIYCYYNEGQKLNPLTSKFTY